MESRLDYDSIFIRLFLSENEIYEKEKEKIANVRKIKVSFLSILSSVLPMKIIEIIGDHDMTKGDDALSCQNHIDHCMHHCINITRLR